MTIPHDFNLNPGGQIALTGVASLLVNGVVHPLNTVKTLQMVGEKVRIQGLYRGFTAIYGVDAAAFAVAFAVNDFFGSYTNPLFSSITAGVISSPFVSFGEGLMINRQISAQSYASAIKRALRPAGITTTILREIPFNTGVFAVSPYLQNISSISNPYANQVVAGALSGAVAGFITTPCDLIKTIVQSSEKSEEITQIFRAVIEKQGVRGLFVGGITRSAYLGLTGAIMSVAYSTIPSSFPPVLKR